MPQQEIVKLYTLSTCSHCKATKRFLDEQGIEYSYIDVDLLYGDERVRILDEVRKYNPACSFPTILIGGKVIVGFRETEIRKALNI
jgi:glutaredoxin-like protein NrdH